MACRKYCNLAVRNDEAIPDVNCCCAICLLYAVQAGACASKKKKRRRGITYHMGGVGYAPIYTPLYTWYIVRSIVGVPIRSCKKLLKIADPIAVLMFVGTLQQVLQEETFAARFYGSCRYKLSNAMSRQPHPPFSAPR